MFRYLISGITLIAASVFFVSQQTPLDEACADYPSRQTLRQNARNNSVPWLFIYDKHGKQADVFHAALDKLKEHSRNSNNIQIIASTEATDSLLSNHPIVLLGASFPDAWYEKIATLPALEINKTQFQLGTHSFSATDDLLKLFYSPNPWNTRFPMHLISGNSIDAFSPYLEKSQDNWGSLIWSSWGYEVHCGDQVRFLGFFEDSTWLFDKKVHYNFETTPVLLAEQKEFSFWSFDHADISLWSENIQQKFLQKRQEIQAFCGNQDSVPIHWYFYPSAEQKALRTGNMEQSHLDFQDHAIHLVQNDFFQGTEWSKQYQLLLRNGLGEPALPILEYGLGLYFADTIKGKHWKEWAALLVAAEAVPSISELTTSDFNEKNNSLVYRFASAMLVDFLLDKWGKETFLKHYNNWPTNTIVSLEKTWKNWLINAYPPIQSTATIYKGPTLNGFTLAHEGYDIFNGYGSLLANESLEEMARMGIDAVAIVPYSYMRNPNRATPIPVVQQTGTENDEAVLGSHFSAKKLGQFTLLKPQIWISGSWPGDVSFESDEEWEAFFEYYENWILHFALLAELYQFDGFCIGTELGKTTLSHPEEWRQLIQKIRQIYTGSLTYAANWGKEFEELTFWEDFDFIGLNSYYPLSKSDNPSPEELTAGIDKIIAKIERINQQTNRKIWLTEIGFRSARHPWKQPHEEAGSRTIDEAAQALCYDLMLQKIQETPTINGMFWWKWPTYLHHNETNGRGYMPYGKKAADVLERYFN